jgi:hypothetical protein
LVVGWRRSVGRPRLCGHSLLTGNFTGKISKFYGLGTSETRIAGQFQAFPVEFPEVDNRELFSENSEVRWLNSEPSLIEIELWGDLRRELDNMIPQWMPHSSSEISPRISIKNLLPASS